MSVREPGSAGSDGLQHEAEAGRDAPAALRRELEELRQAERIWRRAFDASLDGLLLFGDDE